jgi:hypothetical protein
MLLFLKEDVKAGLYHTHLRNLNFHTGTRTVYPSYKHLDLSTCAQYGCLLCYTMKKTYENSIFRDYVWRPEQENVYCTNKCNILLL